MILTSSEKSKIFSLQQFEYIKFVEHSRYVRINNKLLVNNVSRSQATAAATQIRLHKNTTLPFMRNRDSNFIYLFMAHVGIRPTA